MHSPPSLLSFRQEEQTCPTGPHVQMSIPAICIQTSAEASQSDTRTTACLSSEPVLDSLSPSKVQTDTVLPQSRERLMSVCVYVWWGEKETCLHVTWINEFSLVTPLYSLAHSSGGFFLHVHWLEGKNTPRDGCRCTTERKLEHANTILL